MLMQGFAHESQNAKSVDWYTPSWIFEDLGIQFNLDPCHPKERLPWVPVNKHYSIEDDGLSQEWVGNIWCNPPYGKETPKWLEKMHIHRHGIALVFARTDCKWFHQYVSKADAILFLKSRVKFVDGNGVTGGSGAGSGSMLVAWGSENVQALMRMCDKGFLVKNLPDWLRSC